MQTRLTREMRNERKQSKSKRRKRTRKREMDNRREKAKQIDTRPPMPEQGRRMHRQAGDRDKDKEKGPNTHTPTQLRTLGKGTLARARGHGEHWGPEAEEELSDPTGNHGDKQRPTPIVV